MQIDTLDELLNFGADTTTSMTGPGSTTDIIAHPSQEHHTSDPSRITTLIINVPTRDLRSEQSGAAAYIRGLYATRDLIPRMVKLKTLVVYNLPRFDYGTQPVGSWYDVRAAPFSSVSTLVLSGCSPLLGTLWGALRGIDGLSHLDLSQLEPPPGVEALDNVSMLVSELDLEVGDSASFKLRTFSCNLFHLNPPVYSTATLMNILAKHGCFNELQATQLRLHPGSSEARITDKVKEALREMLGAAGLALQRLTFVGFPLGERFSFSTLQLTGVLILRVGHG